MLCTTCRFRVLLIADEDGRPSVETGKVLRWLAPRDGIADAVIMLPGGHVTRTSQQTGPFCVARYVPADASPAEIARVVAAAHRALRRARTRPTVDAGQRRGYHT